MPQVNQLVQQLIQPFKRLGDSRNPRAYTQGLIPYRQKQWLQAVEYFTKATVEQPAHAPSHFKLGMSHFRLKEYEAALAAMTRALELDPSQKQWQEQLDQTARHVVKLSNQTASEKEQAILDQIERLDNPSAMLYNELAHTLRKQAKWQQEAQALRNAITIEDHHPTWHQRLAEALEVLNCYQQAAIAYGKAIDLKQGKASAVWYYRQGYCFSLQEKDVSASLGEAEAAYREAVQRDNKLGAQRYGVGVFHQQSGYWELARKAFQQQLEQAPLDAELLHRVGMAYEHCNDWHKAEYYYTKALSLDIEQPYWHFRLGLMLEYQKKNDEAATAYQFAIAQRSKHTPYWFYSWGRALAFQGKYRDASCAYLKTNKNKSSTGLFNHSDDEVFELLKNSQKLVTDFTLKKYVDKFYDQESVSEDSRRLNDESLLKIARAYELNNCWQDAVRVYKHLKMESLDLSNNDLYKVGAAFKHAGGYKGSVSYFEKINFLEGFEKRIRKEVHVEIAKFEFDGKGYLFGVFVNNKSHINKNLYVNSLILKHRFRIGNETDELHLKLALEKRFNNFQYLEFYFDCHEYDLNMHYWDLHVKLSVSDKVYGKVLSSFACNAFSESVIQKIDQNPWILAIKNDGNILHPYKTVGGKKIAFLKRPLTVYDNPIYYEREQQAIQEYLENKEDLINKKSWLIFEKYSKTAQDNAFYFFKYAVLKRPNVYYVIEKDSPDLKYLEGYESNVVEFMSIKHIKLLLSCDMLIASEGRGHGYAWRRISGFIKTQLLTKKYIFLQHGVIGLKVLDDSFSKMNKNFNADKFICSTFKEKEIIKSNFHYSEENTLLSGLPRWTGLEDISDHYNEIFLMPTWRSWLEDISEKEFLETDYFRYYQEMLMSKELNEMLKKNNFRIKFLLHPKIMQYLNLFFVEQSNIESANLEKVTIRDYVQRAKLLVTDYSSLAWDYLYLTKPVLFYHFDLKDYDLYQGSYLDLKKELPGECSYNLKEFIFKLEYHIKKYADMKKKTLSMRQRIFHKNLKDHSEIIFDEIYDM